MTGLRVEASTLPTPGGARCWDAVGGHRGPSTWSFYFKKKKKIFKKTAFVIQMTQSTMLQHFWPVGIWRKLGLLLSGYGGGEVRGVFDWSGACDWFVKMFIKGVGLNERHMEIVAKPSEMLPPQPRDRGWATALIWAAVPSSVTLGYLLFVSSGCFND